jgi:protein tyrosine/serine phosphatase
MATINSHFVEDLTKILQTPVNLKIDPEIVTNVTSTPPFLPVPDGLNLRTVTAKNLKANSIFRSGTLSHLAQPVVQEFTTKYNITTIFDLRSASEVKQHPDPQVEGVELILVPDGQTLETIKVKAENGDLPAPRKRMTAEEYVANDGIDAYVKMYLEMLTVTHAATYKLVFQRLLDSDKDGGILFHCMAGKDRTGILSALILSLVGSSREEIAHDYMLTRIGIEGMREFLLKSLVTHLGREVSEDTFLEPGMLALCGIDERNILEMLAAMDGRWGGEGVSGVEGYLVKVLGFGKKDVDKIKLRLRAEN